MSAAVSVQQVHKHFGPLHALQGIDLTIRQGEFFGLLGPNGAGKSTLINIIAGLVRAERGSVSVLGHDVVREYRRARQALGIVPQELVYDPFFSVRELLRLQAGYFGCGRTHDDWIEQLLVTLDLAEKADANMHDLSGGMKRRVLIAQALVHKPRVVVLDEPTAGVDVELRQALWQFARQLHAEGRTIVLTTHYLEEAEQLCGRIAILHRGRLVAEDSKAALLARQPYRLLCLTVERADVHLPPTVAPMEVAREAHSITLRLHRFDDSVGHVLEVLHGAGIRVLDISTRDPGLEDVFLELTGGRRSEREGAAA